MAQKYEIVEKMWESSEGKYFFLRLFGKEIQSQKDIVHYNVLP